jgi:casein kinase II subunit beta
MGLSDLPHLKSVKLYCAKCEDIYNPKSSRHAAIDGAYFGASFHNILFQVYPTLIPEKSRRRYEPRIFGFKVHAAAALARWQDNDREMMKRRLRAVGRDGESNTVENVGFVEDGSSEGEEELEEDELGLAGGRENGDGEMEEIQQSVQGA